MQTLALADLKRVAVLGCGAFGCVTLVRHGARNYALKTISKAHIVGNHLSVSSKLGTGASLPCGKLFVLGLTKACANHF